MGIGEGMSKDADLVRRVLAGDAAAYGGLVAHYRDRLAPYAGRMLGDRGGAEEAGQDAFVRAYRSLPRLGHPPRFGPRPFGHPAHRTRPAHARRAPAERAGPGGAGRWAGCAPGNAWGRF